MPLAHRPRTLVLKSLIAPWKAIRIRSPDTLGGCKEKTGSKKFRGGGEPMRRKWRGVAGRSSPLATTSVKKGPYSVPDPYRDVGASSESERCREEPLFPAS